MKLQHYIFLFILLVPGLSACEKSDKDAGVAGTEVNFFNTADGIFTFPGTKAVYVDKLDTMQSDPIQFSGRSPAGETFPALAFAGPGGTASVLYMRQTPGTHRFIFTNGEKQVVADTTVNLTDNSKNTFYVYDDPDQLLSHCMIMHIIENSTNTPDKCQFRLLHLSSDLGEMNCFFILEDGSRFFAANLPAKMKSGTHTDFISIDKQVVGKDGNAYLQFFSGTDTTGVKATATIPYREGRSYAIVVSGLANMKYVQYKDPADPGNPRTVLLNASISARVRTVN